MNHKQLTGEFPLNPIRYYHFTSGRGERGSIASSHELATRVKMALRFISNPRIPKISGRPC